MNILIITTYFLPDTAIAAVRPYMFAKYLSQNGHRITVLRSGMAHRNLDRSLDYDDLNISIYSYLGKNSVVERYMRGEQVNYKGRKQMIQFSFLPPKYRERARWLYYGLRSPFDFVSKWFGIISRYFKQKKYINALSAEHYDVVFATYGEFENIFAGKYAAKKFKCRWILDFRDPIAQRTMQCFWEYPIWKLIQKKAVTCADVCTAVSDGVAQEVAYGTNKKIITLYNGYEQSNIYETEMFNDNKLHICYTGTMYNESRIEPLFAAIKNLAKRQEIELSNIIIHYAGLDFTKFSEWADKYGARDYLINHGYIGKCEAEELQLKCDVFLLLTWNTTGEKGVLTGKFYEGIRCCKPILVIVSGDAPNSEIKNINDKYNYGYCYEICGGDKAFEEFECWLKMVYSYKISGSRIPYNPNPDIFIKFRYDNLTNQLEDICNNLIGDVLESK
ncbi:MAG: hypothetical protein IJ336_04915 [Lachnospiraceae bacterium]|nr:hypothetical protein [Lachnospiraceae bacterium]